MNKNALFLVENKCFLLKINKIFIFQVNILKKGVA